MSKGYVPERGDVVWVNFTPQSGSEQAGDRPAVVITATAFNRRGFFGVMPIAGRAKGYPFEVPLPAGGGTKGVILADQFKILDWRSRNVRRKGKTDAAVVTKCVGLLLAVVDPDGEFTVAEDESV